MSQAGRRLKRDPLREVAGLVAGCDPKKKAATCTPEKVENKHLLRQPAFETRKGCASSAGLTVKRDDVGASAQDWAKAQTHGGNRKPVTNQDVNQGATLHLETVDGRAAESGASIRTQKMADKVAKEAPDLAVKVARGEITLPKALLQVEGKKAPAKKPEPLPEDSPVHEPTEDEIAYILAQQDSDQRAIEAILEGNGDIAALKKEYDRMAHEMATVKAQRDEYMNKCNELIRIIKSLRGKLNKLPKAA